MEATTLQPQKFENFLQELTFSVITLKKKPTEDGRTELRIAGVDAGFRGLFGTTDPSLYMERPLHTLFSSEYRDFPEILALSVGQKHITRLQHLKTKENFLAEISLSEVPTGQSTSVLLCIIQKIVGQKRKSCDNLDTKNQNVIAKARRLSLSARRPSLAISMEGDVVVRRGGAELFMGKYLIGAPIAINEKNRVHAAINRETGESVVVKMCAIANDGDNKNRLKLEYDNGSKLNHPNIAKYLDCIETETDICIFMEYCGDETLESYIKQHGVLSEDEAREFFSQMVDALECCHQQKVLHGDIKLSNVLIFNGTVKLIDFDASKSETTERTTFCGTIAYMSPEIILQRSYSGETSDLWSLGVCLFVMLSASFPFNSLAETIDGLFAIPKNLSEDCVNLIRSILQVEPDKRPSFAQSERIPG